MKKGRKMCVGKKGDEHGVRERGKTVLKAIRRKLLVGVWEGKMQL